MVRHTHRRRNSRRRRQTRGRRTQKGGSGWSDFFSSTPNDDDIKKLQQKLNMETDLEKKADIQEELSIAQAKQIKDRTLKQIRERGAQSKNMDMSNNGMGMGMGMGNNNMARNSAGNFQSYNNTSYNNNMDNLKYGGSRRRRRHRRK